MAMKNKKGLQAVFGDDLKNAFDSIENFEKENADSAQEVGVNLLKPNPFQPRRVFDEEKLNELASSIKTHGIFTPIIVKKDGDEYIIVAGERRTKAAKIAGLESIPAIIVDFDDVAMREIALLENIQREQLNEIEIANSYKELMETLNLTQAKLATRLGKSRSSVANTLRLLELPEIIRNYVLDSSISAGHAKAVAGLKDEGLMIKLIDRTIEESLSVRKLESIIGGYKLKDSKGKQEKKEPSVNYAFAESLLRKKLRSKVGIKNNKITINFTTTSDLNRVLEILGVIE